MSTPAGSDIPGIWWHLPLAQAGGNQIPRIHRPVSLVNHCVLGSIRSPISNNKVVSDSERHLTLPSGL